MGSVPQISTRADIERLSPLSQTSPFQHGGNTNDDLRQSHVDIDAKTREDDQDRATKDASPDCTDETQIQNEKSESEQKKEEGTEKGNEEDKDELTDKDTEEGSDQNLNKDQDSDVGRCR